jgi:hypothetical protein
MLMIFGRYLSQNGDKLRLFGGHEMGVSLPIPD